MRKVFLVICIAVDLAVMAMAAFFLYAHLTRKGASTLSAIAPPSTPAAPTPPAAGTASPSGLPAPGEEDGYARKILFTYANSKARQVSIRADFTGWKAEPMTRDEKGVWTYQANLEAGEYGYAYSILDERGNSRTIRDMANPKTKKIGTQFVSSLVVEPLQGR